MATDNASKQPAHDKLQDLLDTTNAAYDAARTDEQRDRLASIADATSAALTALNRLDMHSRTDAFNAAEEPLQAAMARLSTLQKELNAVAAGFAQVAEVATAIDRAASEVCSLFAV